MDSTELIITVACGLAIAVGMLGVVVPVLPGLLLVWAGVAVWAFAVADGPARWAVVGLATVLAVGATVAKYAWPGRRLRDSGVPARALAAGALLGFLGFFVLPVVGLPVGFVAGVWAAEAARLGGLGTAWPSTRQALAAVGASMVIEWTAAMVIGLAWLVGVATRI
ncbi:MAG TPA: DUF456 domain-containing protein [Pilimelia sp.]|nr:DUF456 domain-containing protein [Pilimelia sp.]